MPESPAVDEASVAREQEREHFLKQVEDMLKRGGDLAFAADFDQNLSLGGASKGLDPRDSFIHPKAQEAIRDIVEAGRDYVIISSRGARDVARIVNIPGVEIIGSLGWETFVADEKDPRHGRSEIHPQFGPYASQITAILGEVRERFFAEDLHIPVAIPDEPNLALSSPSGGVVVLQRKGFNEEFKEGITLTWNLNQLGPETRKRYNAKLTEYYEKAFAEVSSPDTREALAQLCGIMHRPGNNGLWYDLEMRPTSQSAKANAMEQLQLPVSDPHRLQHFQHMPGHKLWIYSGDHIEQDTPVMRLPGVLGIWSRPKDEEYRKVEGINVTVDGVLGNASLHQDMAALVKKYAA